MSEEGEPRGGWSAGGLLAILGVIVLVAGVIAYFYEEVKGSLWVPSYRWLGVLLMILGVALIVAEAFLHFYKPKKQTPQPTP